MHHKKGAIKKMKKRMIVLLCLLLICIIGGSISGNLVQAKDISAKTTGGLKIEVVTGTEESSSSSSDSSTSYSSSSGDSHTSGSSHTTTPSSSVIKKPGIYPSTGEQTNWFMPILGLLVIGSALVFLIKKTRKQIM